MTIYLYFSLIPEALIVSMLPPEDFGHYLAVGSKYLTKGQAVFFDIDPEFRHPFFDIDDGIRRCVPHDDGTPKNSVYIAVYRVLEHIPLNVIGKLHLVTDYGQTLEIERGRAMPESSPGYYMYHDLAPISSLVVSTLPPQSYYESVTIKPPKLIRFPGLAFVDLELGALATDPEHGAVADLPYSGIPHIRECLYELESKNKKNKLVDRLHTAEFPYRMVKSGFFIGNGPDLAFYPMPSRDQLREEYHHWWRMANL